jgi:hypothetical protein
MARLMLTDLYDALRAANIPEDKARAAASSVADFDGRIERIETKLTVMMSFVGGHAGRLLCSLGAAGRDVGQTQRVTATP